MVTPLPCDKRHYFHSKCIEQWSQNHNDCPLCKKTFNAEILAEAQSMRTTLVGHQDEDGTDMVPQESRPAINNRDEQRE